MSAVSAEGVEGAASAVSVEGAGRTAGAGAAAGVVAAAGPLARLRRDRGAMAAVAVLAALVALCAAGPGVADAWLGVRYDAQDLGLGPTPPSAAHLCGTDAHGRDLCVRMLAGGQVSLWVGLGAAAVAIAFGTLYGAGAANVGGGGEALMMRTVDVIDGLPAMFLVIVLMASLGRGLGLVWVALGMTGWLTAARIVRGQLLALRDADFVLAARALGVGEARIVWRHLLPHTLGPMAVYFTLGVPAMILQEAFLSFLGLGVQAPRPSLGSLIAEGAEQMRTAWWTLALPAALLAAVLLALTRVGDGVRDALDPRLGA